MTSRIEQIQKASMKPVKKNEASMNSRAVDKINALPGCVAFKHHGTPYSVAGHSDIYGCAKGRAFFLEGKLPGKKPRPNQIEFLKRMEEAGAITGVYFSSEEAVELLADWLLSAGKELSKNRP